MCQAGIFVVDFAMLIAGACAKTDNGRGGIAGIQECAMKNFEELIGMSNKLRKVSA